MTKIKFYGASKIEGFNFWRSLRELREDVEFTNRWMDKCLAAQGKPHKPNAAQSERAWLIDFADIQRADYLLLLAPFPYEHLRGGLVEAGYAIAIGKPVFLLGDHPDFGSWKHHPMVRQFSQNFSLVSNANAAIDFVLGIDQ